MTTWTKHGRGLGITEPHRRDARTGRYSASGLVGAGVAPVRSASMRDLVFDPTGFVCADQEGSQACVGWTIAQCLHIRSRTAGMTAITPSPDAAYWQARARRYGYAGVFDGGCNPLDAWESVRECGIVPYDRWPHILLRKNDAPPAAAYRYAVDCKWLRYHWVLESGSARTATVCGLLASRRPVAVALMVDQGLEDWQTGDEPWTRHGPVLGGHAVTLIGYEMQDNGRVRFEIKNSWGSWGARGIGWISQSALEYDETSYLVTPDIGGLT